MIPTDKKIVACADSQREILVNGPRTLIIWMLAANPISWLLYGLRTMPWLQLVTVFGIAVFCITRRILRANRSLAQTPCPACDRAVGAHFTENSRVHLLCRHCGEVSPTDCGVVAMGGLTFKITH